MFVYSEDVEAQLKVVASKVLDEVISDVLALQTQDIDSGPVKTIVTENLVRAGLGCTVDCCDKGLIALLFVTAADIPVASQKAMLAVSERIEELLSTINKSKSKILAEPENFRRLDPPRFRGVTLVYTAEEEALVKRAFGCCGGNCKCAAATKASLPTLRSPGGPSDRPPEEGERCVS